MKRRIALQYGVPQAVIGCLAVLATGLAMTRTTIGVTRQPLPLIWPLAVLQVVVSQLPQRAIVGPLERAAVRGRTTRTLQAAPVVVLLATGPTTYMAEDHALVVAYLAVAAAGFLAALNSGVDPWVWTLTSGMTLIGLMFLTPLGQPISEVLTAVPALSMVLAATCCCALYIWQGPRLVA